ncbi:MAG: 4'-phosphopantetheinyl transferase superfamily protein [Atopobiaceae bacterium]|nr:4'-phosphopantetheinyl transferase superfamily protein [Atopobiaceae bacterium]
MPLTCRYYDVTELADPELFARGMELLPWPDRREKALRYRFAKDQRLCVGAGLLAAHMLRQAGARDLTLGYADFDKPYLANHPSIHFNLSHSGHVVACAVSDAPVGVDVEVVHDHGPAVAAYCYQPQELDWLAQADDTAHAFTRLWVRKESYIKLIGTGLSREPRSFSVIPGEPMENDAAFAEFAVHDCLLCVCAFAKAQVTPSEWKLADWG